MSEKLSSETRTEIEELIFSAKEYVVASDQLRPRVLEEAREASKFQRNANRAVLGGLGFLVAWGVAIPLVTFFLGTPEDYAGPSQYEIQKSAAIMTNRYSYDPEWGMVDAFTKARQVNSSQDSPSSHPTLSPPAASGEYSQ